MTKEQIEYATKRIIELVDLKKINGFYQTFWGIKTDEGLKASIFNIIADADKKD